MPPTPPVARPPVARKIPKVDVVHGDVRQDDYYWMREKDDPEEIGRASCRERVFRTV